MGYCGGHFIKIYVKKIGEKMRITQNRVPHPKKGCAILRVNGPSVLVVLVQYISLKILVGIVTAC